MADRLFGQTIKPIVSGMALTMKHYIQMLVAREKVYATVQYPEQRREQFPRTRWRHVLRRYDNGLERCIGCSLCKICSLCHTPGTILTYTTPQFCHQAWAVHGVCGGRCWLATELMPSAMHADLSMVSSCMCCAWCLWCQLCGTMGSTCPVTTLT